MYICEVTDTNDQVVDEAHTTVQVVREKTAASWKEVVDGAIPSKCRFQLAYVNSIIFVVRIFDSKNIKAGWNTSKHVIFTIFCWYAPNLVEEIER